MSAWKKVLLSIVHQRCCILQDRNTDQLDSWSPPPYFDEDSYPSPPRNMKGLSSGRPQLTFTSGHTCGLPDCDQSLDHLQHVGPDSRSPYLLSPTESCPLDPHRCSPRSSIHSECMVMPVSMASDHVSSSTFPRMHYSSHQDSLRDDGSTSHGGGGGGGGVSIVSGGGGSGKMNRIPANLLDQFEKQLPIHRDGFHTLQYQRTSATTTNSEQRNESPGRIRHLVHSVQKLFTKSHSLEGSSKMNGTKGDSRSDSGHHHHHHHHHGHDHGSHKHSKRSKSKERKSDSKQRSGIAGWWSSDDNLDSDSTYRTPSIMSRHHGDHITHCYPDMGHGHFGDLSLKTSKSNNDVKCSACESIAMAPEGKFMKRSSWSTLTVSQAKEAYRKSSLNLEKPTMPQDLKSSMRPCHFLQVPQDEWGGRDEEIPCRRMRSSSYVKAMGDQDSGDSDGSPKNSPQKMVRPNALVKSVLQRQLSDQSSYRLDKSSRDMVKYLTNITADLSQSYHLQTSREIHPSITLEPSPNYNSPKFRSRNQSYMRAVSTLSQASCVSQVSQVSETEVNGQFESVCESVFSEVESQAMDALDLPGCFRTRSHSYLRAIQAGFSQDDDCVPSMTSSTVTSTIRSTTGIQFHLPSSGSVDRPSQQPPAVTYTPSTPTYKRTPPPVPPRSTSKPLISITAQSSTESTQDAYHEGQLARGFWGSDGSSLSLGRALYNSTDSLDSAKAVTIAMEAAAMAMAGKRHPSTDSHSSVMTCDKAVLVSKAEEYLKTPRSSIGIQVEAATDSECESKGSREYQSVGIQVEDERRQGRFKRSNSVTAAVQADLELEGFPLMEDKGLQFGGGFQRHSEPSTPTQYGAVRTVRTQGLFSYREDYRTPTEPPSPQRSPEPWLEPSPREPIATVAVTVTPPQPSDSGRASPSCRRDGSWFMQLLHTETKKMEGWCKELEGEAEENDLSEEILGKIRSAVGSAQLLMSQKFQQFYWLCQQNLDPSAMPRPTSQDLAGFWDLLQLSIDDVTSKFNELQKIKSNDWRLIDSPVKKLPPPVPKKTLRKSVTREKSLDLPDRQRIEARRRLMAAKRAASFRQNSASERADSIEIYIPEAQTRL
ncbi:disks large-associated protein 2 isoform X5 [Danio rerio]|uniref:Disks large-associated protein 2 isoform X5 n=1 Tax=Danio rerio TaxID=7955 RepID=A0AC58HRN3_DANRE